MHVLHTHHSIHTVCTCSSIITITLIPSINFRICATTTSPIDYLKLDVSPQPLELSENFNHEQLAVWLINHPKFVGKGYQQDISKLKGK